MNSDWQALYPFASHELMLDGRRYHYLDEGQGEPLLLVHGNPTWSFYWRALVVALRNRYRLIVPDHMGCGLSDKPQRYEYRLAKHIENLSRLVESLDLKNVTLVAHDWGGAIGAGAALQSPNRFARIVMMNTAAFHSPYIPWRIRLARMPLLGTLAVRGGNAFLQAALRMALEKRENMSAQVRAGYLAPYNSWRNRVAVDRFVKDIPRNPGHPSYETLRHMEQTLHTLADRPWLLLWGMQDWCFHDWYLRRFLELIPQAEVRRLPEAGHWLVEDDPQEVIASLQEFISRHPLGKTVPSLSATLS
ncbi:MAG TPA: alpha/beta fold hydrolase [Pirellulales bacterium]|jgi:haloalkane dehalogenase|nr:alpha/beta fold hydrolase [Pirellulales bacterium]